MKRKSLTLLSAGALLILAVSPGWSVTQDHSALAASYEERAKAQDGVIAEHQKMKQEGVTEKTSAAAKAKMDKHCDAIINDAKKLQADYKAFAQWHRLQAAETQGKQ